MLFYGHDGSCLQERQVIKIDRRCNDYISINLINVALKVSPVLTVVT